MLTLAQVDPKLVDTAANHIERNPMILPTVILAAMLVTMIVAVVLAGRGVGPWMERREKAFLEYIANLLAARGKESERDMQQVTETLGLKMENRMDRITDGVGNVRADIASLKTDLIRIAAKIGAAGIVLLLLTGAVMATQDAHMVLARRVSHPDLCNPRCPAGQQCMGKICTKMAAPKQPPRVADLPTATAPKTAPPPVPKDRKSPGPQSHNYAVLTQQWTDGRDPFEVEPETNP